jgi:hypothetical protein
MPKKARNVRPRTQPLTPTHNPTPTPTRAAAPKPPAPPPPAAATSGLTVRVKADPNTDPKAARKIHCNAIAGMVYANALKQRIGAMLPDSIAQSAMLYVDDLIERMSPRDPAEEMLVTQLVLTHARVLHLTDLANRQQGLEQIRTMHEYTDRASNTYRRLMLTLAEYRRPPAESSFTAIRQANIANQQVVQNHENSGTNATNEQGFTPDTTAGHAHERPPSLPAHAGGLGRTASIRPPGEALGAVNGAADA